MSAGPSLYRRHRPRTFADVVGQEHVVRTLAHAVERDQIHHAYLFVGSRGTGKTSMAKILAACLNCDSGPTISPCGTCDSCMSIASANSLDVIEMDAASNNSVDDIRELREKVGYAPVSGKHKVYILDEAHMLSTQAWNAFLKTLEEPPPRTVFVLATTEANKVLPTVVDRCHRFDFGRPSAEQVMTVIERVAGQESIQLDPGAAALIARHATGSFRDALGTLEQLVTYVGGERIEPQDVLDVLGVADAEQLFRAVDAIVASDAAAALRAAAQLASSGRDPGQVLRDLEVHARELLTVQIIGEVPPELRVTADRDAKLLHQASTLGDTDAVRLLELVSQAIEATSNGAQPRIQLELVLIKAAAPEVDPSTSALLARIERLERARRAPAPALAAVAMPPSSAPAPSKQVVPEADAPATEPIAVPPAVIEHPAPLMFTGSAAASGAAAEPEPDVEPDLAPPPVAPAPLDATITPEPASPPAAPVQALAAPAPAPATDFGPDGPDEMAPEDDQAPSSYVDASPFVPGPEPVMASPVVESASAAPVLASVAAPAAAAQEQDLPPADLEPPFAPSPATQYEPEYTNASDLDLPQITQVWPAVVELVRAANGMLAVLIEAARPVAVSGTEVVLAFPPEAEFQRRKAEQDEHRRTTQEALHNVTGVTLAIRYELAHVVVAQQDQPEPVAPKPLTEDELVHRFVEEFGAQEISETDQETE